MIKALATLFTTFFFSSSVWATAKVIPHYTDMEVATFNCAAVYGYKSASGDEGELKENMEAKFKYWRHLIHVDLRTEEVDEMLRFGMSSLEESLEAKLISNEEVTEIMESCEEIRKEVEAILTKVWGSREQRRN